MNNKVGLALNYETLRHFISLGKGDTLKQIVKGQKSLSADQKKDIKDLWNGLKFSVWTRMGSWIYGISVGRDSSSYWACIAGKIAEVVKQSKVLEHGLNRDLSKNGNEELSGKAQTKTQAISSDSGKTNTRVTAILAHLAQIRKIQPPPLRVFSIKEDPLEDIAEEVEEENVENRISLHLEDDDKAELSKEFSRTDDDFDILNKRDAEIYLRSCKLDKKHRALPIERPSKTVEQDQLIPSQPLQRVKRDCVPQELHSPFSKWITSEQLEQELEKELLALGSEKTEAEECLESSNHDALPQLKPMQSGEGPVVSSENARKIPPNSTPSSSKLKEQLDASKSSQSQEKSQLNPGRFSRVKNKRRKMELINPCSAAAALIEKRRAAALIES